MATYNDIKKIKIGDNTFVFHVPTASEVGALPSSTTIPTVSFSDITSGSATINLNGVGYSFLRSVTVPTITLNGSTTTSPSFYAPTSVGTSGNYLKSSGSGAPTWASFPTIPSITLNGSSTTSPNFYAPTGAGTSGQYLKSNGSGAPSWTNFPTIPTITLNGSSSTSPSFYAPTSAGTSGYYLKSNGSGAPTWTAFPTIPTIPSNNVTGSGTSGQLAQWNGTNTLTNGPKITYSTATPSGGSDGDIWFVIS